MNTTVYGDTVTTVPTKRFEISAAWARATGKGDKPVTFDVVREYKRNGMTFIDVIDNGREWTINADWRGRFV